MAHKPLTLSTSLSQRQFSVISVVGKADADPSPEDEILNYNNVYCPFKLHVNSSGGLRERRNCYVHRTRPYVSFEWIIAFLLIQQAHLDTIQVWRLCKI